MSKQNWFETLNAALEAEDLLEYWNCTWAPLHYGETRSWTTEDGRYITIYRDDITGKYERPIHYAI
jgi:hypothetical protein